MSKKELTILQINDTHAYMEPHYELFWSGSKAEYKIAGGFANITSMVNKIRNEKNGNVIFLDNGDTIHGTFAAVISEGEALIPVLNELKLDAMTAHWDFAYGPEKLKEISQKLNYPVLAINCYKKNSGELFFDPYLIKEINGIKIGVIGIASNIIDKTMPPKFSEGIYFTLGNEELPEYINELKNKNVDLIIVLSHLGFPHDVKLANEIKGIDILLSGHTHNRTFSPVKINETVIIQSGAHGSFLGKIEIQLDDNRIKNFKHQLITIDDSIFPDNNIDEMINEIYKPHRNYLNQIAGKIATALNRNSNLESTMDNFLTQSLIDITGSEISFSNGWRYGAPVPAGEITMNDLWNIIPVNPEVQICKITGEEIRQMLEENLERTFSSDPYKQMGGYVKRFSGMNLYFKIENQFNLRVQNIFVNEKPIDLKRNYEAAYVTNQGIPDKFGSERTSTNIKAIDALAKYLNKFKMINSEITGKVLAI